MLNFLYPSIIIMTLIILFFGYRFFKGYITLVKYLYWIIFGIYITCLVDFTLFPFPYQKYLIQVMIEDHLGNTNNFVPFKVVVDSIRYGSFSIALKQVGGNILLFMPLGFALPVLYPMISKYKVILVGFTVSLGIEIIQGATGFILGYNYRSCDIDDLLLNTFGSVLGVIVFSLSTKFSIEKKNDNQYTKRQGA
ncbi:MULTISPECIES: VanZ family protein [unclassified Bacillus (in: firmicutes)]|uniref:VanZ family protein n=1 Tax=unclassified Bacillus (in: firmicutes) TaxID=185979 RepID=UPI0008E24AEF|nr:MULTISPECIES: VanZ family protein [unclassified Bacillus (in: firmicutes)]SFD20100.1 Glycopeptide antibiotics resistance protein [Bacillus sp. UNCCL81]